jgi:hypothetical protein
MAVFTEAKDAGGAVGVGTPDHAAPQRPFYVKISRPLDWYSAWKPLKMYTWVEPHHKSQCLKTPNSQNPNPKSLVSMRIMANNWKA